MGNMWSELDAFHLRIEPLFVKGNALSTGYTKIALEYLCKPRIIEVPGICLRSLGCKSGAEETNTTRALARMANWVKVTHESNKTEFRSMTCSPSSNRSLCPIPATQAQPMLQVTPQIFHTLPRSSMLTPPSSSTRRNNTNRLL